MTVVTAPAAEIEFSVVVLCYREAERIPALLASVESEVQRLGQPYEIVLVANYVEGSHDRSPEIASELARGNPRVKVVAKPKQGMMGWDMRSGLEAATGRVVAVIDGDGQIHPSYLLAAYRELREKGLDLCQTVRVQREDGWKRAALSAVYNRTFRALFPGTGLHDINAKPKVMTREAYRALRLTSDDWFIDAEIVIQARRNGWLVGEVPSRFDKSRARPSFINMCAMVEFVKNLAVFRVREALIRRKAGRP